MGNLSANNVHHSDKLLLDCVNSLRPWQDTTYIDVWPKPLRDVPSNKRCWVSITGIDHKRDNLQ